MATSREERGAMAGDAFVNVTQCTTADEARATATRLVERGIGATVAKLPAPPGDAAGDERPYAVQVLADQEARARELLDESPDDARPDASPSGAAVPSASTSPPTSPPDRTEADAGLAPGADAPGAASGLAAGPAAGPAGAVPPLGDAAERSGRWGDGAGGIGVAGALDDDEPLEVEKGPIPWKKVLLIWAAALILIPLAAFWLTYLILSR
ncbi:MAG: hypothetical protein U0Q07_12505 [Acidimicrobiales bacterium]